MAPNTRTRAAAGRAIRVEAGTTCRNPPARRAAGDNRREAADRRLSAVAAEGGKTRPLALVVRKAWAVVVAGAAAPAAVVFGDEPGPVPSATKLGAGEVLHIRCSGG
jgi:hypothetical protein